MPQTVNVCVRMLNVGGRMRFVAIIADTSWLSCCDIMISVKRDVACARDRVLSIRSFVDSVRWNLDEIQAPNLAIYCDSMALEFVLMIYVRLSRSGLRM